MIPHDLEQLLRKHRFQGVVLDSNLLVLLIMGLVEPSLINAARPTRNRSFTPEDFELLGQLIQRAGKVVTTPHILAETSNLLDQFKGADRPTVLECFAQFIRGTKESQLPAVELLAFDFFSELGVTDSGVCSLVQKRYLAITVDGPLAEQLRRGRQPVINFTNYCRALRG